jgi:hypothetical protein
LASHLLAFALLTRAATRASEWRRGQDQINDIAIFNPTFFV